MYLKFEMSSEETKSLDGTVGFRYIPSEVLIFSYFDKIFHM